MQIKGLNHIVLTVSDLERSRKFYGEILGFEVTDATYDAGEVMIGFLITVGEVPIYFLKHKAMPPTDRFSEARVGLDHLSFTVTSETELQAMSAKLLAAGVDTKGLETFPTGNRYIAFRDPDNIQLEYWLVS